MNRFPLRARLLLLAFVPAVALAGGATHNPPDNNSYLEVLSASSAGDVTRLLYFTRPGLGDPRPAGGCGFNYYVATLRSGLSSPHVELIAENHCRPGATGGIASADDEALILAGDGLERWRAGAKVDGRAFDELAGNRALRQQVDQGGGFVSVAEDASGVLGLPNAGSEYVVVSIDDAGEERWVHRLSEPGQRMDVMHVWAGIGGRALLQVSSAPADGSSMNIENKAVLIDADGKVRAEVTLTRDNQPDMAAIMRAGESAQGDPSLLAGLLEDGYTELLKRIVARPREDGGFDILFERSSGDKVRQGHWLLRMGPGGAQAEVDLTPSIAPHGLDRWVDFYLNGDTLLLLGNVMASQAAHGGRKAPQTAISWIDTETNGVTTRLLPLDERYVEDLLNATDATYQYLENLPGGEPRLLTSLGGQPLAVSQGLLDNGLALRFDEGSGNLVTWDEAWDQQQRQLAKEKAREERKVAREARSEAFDQDMAKAIGVSPEEYTAMSNKERKRAMATEGDMQAMMAAAMQQAQLAQQAMAQGGAAGGANADVAAQIEAAMAQYQAAMSAAGQPMPESAPGASGPGVAAAAASNPANSLKVDAGHRGFVQFQTEDHSPVRLCVIDRESGEELLNKDYPDGSVYEYLDFNRFGLPLVRIGVQLRDASGGTLKDMTPVVAP